LNLVNVDSLRIKVATGGYLPNGFKWWFVDWWSI
jgi:hypothetical protein